MTPTEPFRAISGGGDPETEWRRPAPSRRESRRDILLAVVMFAATLVSTALYSTISYTDDTAEPWVIVLWAAALNLPLAARRRYPEVVAVIASISFMGMVPLVIPELLFSTISLFIAFYSIGAWSTNRRRALIVRTVIVIGMFAWLFGDLYFRSLDPEMLPMLSRVGTVSPYAAFGLINVIVNLLYFWGGWYFGDTAYAAARQRHELEQRTIELADERERTAVQAVTRERLRIARELHDVVAHHVSVMGVQAGAARRIIDRDPAGATTALTAIEGSARSAIDDLHRMLGTLRDEGAVTSGGTGRSASGSASGATGDGVPAGSASDESSTRGIEQLSELVDAAVAAGLPTSLTIVGVPREVPTTIGLTVYRITQEALTNARKHAGAAATAEVRVRFEADAVEIEVSDTGVGARAASRDTSRGSSGGLGLVGMRERVDATGGTLETGPRPRGGFLVRARFATADAARGTAGGAA
ncbi:sensor histidine kinase [Marisediminicola sp. LYQ134]|uniref:sensor histidine kinase n=1 Tax=Marisediminicola sp. LYQ134 TaxID=3391061 RepID=UPI003983113F